MKTTEQKAKYIVALTKQADKTIEYAIGIIPWYSCTEKEDKEIERLIKHIWNSNSKNINH